MHQGRAKWRSTAWTEPIPRLQRFWRPSSTMDTSWSTKILVRGTKLASSHQQLPSCRSKRKYRLRCQEWSSRWCSTFLASTASCWLHRLWSFLMRLTLGRGSLQLRQLFRICCHLQRLNHRGLARAFLSQAVWKSFLGRCHSRTHLERKKVIKMALKRFSNSNSPTMWTTARPLWSWSLIWFAMLLAFIFSTRPALGPTQT